MGMLLRQDTSERVVLRMAHVIGRNSSRSDTVLLDPDTSLLHAVVRWRGGAWNLTSHGRNGTWLDEKRLPDNAPALLAADQVLRFGSRTALGWRIVDLAAPGSVLMPLDAALEPIHLRRFTLLPNGIEPELALCEESPGYWEMERDGARCPLRNGDVLEFAGARYQLIVINSVDDTHAALAPVAPPLLTFRLSLDEEHANLHVRCGQQSADLGERIHHYALVTLARKRAADAHAGLDSTAQGWIESSTLARMLGIELAHLNIQIFRARDQFVNTLKEQGPLSRVIERRRGSLRMGPVGFEIYRGSELEGSLMPQAGSSTQ